MAEDESSTGQSSRLLLPSELLTLFQAVDRLIDRQAPGLRQKVDNDHEELQRLEHRYAEVICAFRAETLASSLATFSRPVILPPDFTKPVSRSPPPIRPLRRGPQTAVSTRRPTESKEVYKKLVEDEKQSRMRLTELQTDRAKLVAEKARWIAWLAQALCDARIQALLLWDLTGEEIPIPTQRWRTAHGVAALQTGRLTLDTAAVSRFLRNPASFSEHFVFLQKMPVFEGRVALLKVDFNQLMACLTPAGVSTAPGNPVVPDVEPSPPPPPDPALGLSPIEPALSKPANPVNANIDELAAASSNDADASPPNQGGQQPPPEPAKADWKLWLQRYGKRDRALKEWATDKYGNDVPSRDILLKHHRCEFGAVKGISEKAMRPVRSALASKSAKLGGAPTHKAHG